MLEHLYAAANVVQFAFAWLDDEPGAMPHEFANGDSGSPFWVSAGSIRDGPYPFSAKSPPNPL